jgi:hypothetical protein
MAPAESNLFGGKDEDQELIDAYVRAGRTLDDLPYTDEFDAIMHSLDAKDTPEERYRVLHRLQNLRKANKLPRLGKSASPAVKVREDEEQFLVSLVTERAGTLGQRDALVHTAAFTEIVTTFNARTGRNLNLHDAWRLVAKLAK